ncbi:MAG: type II secretion system F family protein [Candidatus Aenigmatarchaeota archaeon]
MSYVTISQQFFGSISKSLKVYFLDTRDELQKANLNYTLEEYLSMALFTTMITFIAENVILAFIFGLAGSPVRAVLLSLTISLAISGLIFFLFYSYPSTLAKSREKEIRKILPFAISYMATVSSAKAPPITLFKTLARFKEYGEVSDEAKTIVKDVEMFGMTFSGAVKKRAKKTSSSELREILWGINTVISSGSDLTSYLRGKAEESMNDYRRRIRKYSQDLSLFIEIYLTLIITGSIFFIVLSSIISAISGGLWIVSLHSFIIFILLPLLSMGFIILLKSLSPS